MIAIDATVQSEFESILGSIVGSQNIRSSEELLLPRSWKAGGIVLPGCVEELSAVTVAAEKLQVALIPVGGANQLNTGYPPDSDRPYCLVGTSRLNRVLDYQPDDLTITCEAGVTPAQAEQTLRQHNQMLALDGALPDTSTLGGMVAAATAGCRRRAYGTPRDALIGMRAVMTGGVDVKGGGKVVKNVAGYDVCKLFTGSWGSLGVLTELTFKVRPLPEVSCRLSWKTPDIASAVNAGFKLHLAGVSPTMVQATTDLEGSCALTVGFEGTAKRVEWQTSEAARRLSDEGIRSPGTLLTDVQYANLNNWPATIATDAQASFRASCLPAELSAIVSRIAAIPTSNILADCAVGSLHCSFSTADCSTVAALSAIMPLHSNCVWTRLDIDDDCADSIPRWGNMREERHLQAAIKSSLDPLNTFSPGRFPGPGR